MMQKRVTAVAHEVVSIYKTASIPVIDTKSVVNRIKKLINKVKGLAKYPSSKKTSINYQDCLKSLQTVFGICTCKCVDKRICNVFVHCRIKHLQQNGLSGWTKKLKGKCK